MSKWAVVNTDNFGGDYPDEKFVGQKYETEEAAKAAADELNGPYEQAVHASRYFKVVKVPYKLAPAFEP